MYAMVNWERRGGAFRAKQIEDPDELSDSVSLDRKLKRAACAVAAVSNIHL